MSKFSKQIDMKGNIKVLENEQKPKNNQCFWKSKVVKTVTKSKPIKKLEILFNGEPMILSTRSLKNCSYALKHITF